MNLPLINPFYAGGVSWEMMSESCRAIQADIHFKPVFWSTRGLRSFASGVEATLGIGVRRAIDHEFGI